VYLMISNKAETASWATTCPHRRAHPPTVLRGLEPDSSSASYDPALSGQSWTSVTFKVTGFMTGQGTSILSEQNRIPLRWFAFHEGSFRPRGDANEYEAVIDVRWPYTKESPAMAYGMREWLYRHPDLPQDQYPLFLYYWSLDDRLQPMTTEILLPDSTY